MLTVKQFSGALNGEWQEVGLNCNATVAIKVEP